MSLLFNVDAVAGPHQAQPVFTSGALLTEARAAAILIHGRGATARDILTLVPHIDPLAGMATPVAYLAPQAAGFSWYPDRFLAPLERNQPWLSSALALLGQVVAAMEEQGIPPERILLLGFSQGACLALEFAARHARRYGGLAALSGGLIGPDGAPRDYAGSLEGTPAFLGCSDVDPHIPLERVHHSAEVLRRLGAQVSVSLYPGMGHTVNNAEIVAVRAMLAGLTDGQGK